MDILKNQISLIMAIHLTQILNQSRIRSLNFRTLKSLEAAGKSIINASIGDPKDDTPAIFVRQILSN